MIDRIIEIIEKDIVAVKEQIGEYLDYYQDNEFINNIDELIDDCMNWEGNDINLSFEVGYLRALEVLITTLQKERE